MERYQQIEHSIIKRYRKSIWSRFTKALKEYRLVNEGDKIAVCISGGKDSMLMAKCLQELQKHSKVPFSLEYMVMDPGYNARNRQKIEENAKILNLPIQVFETDIFEVVSTIEQSPCYLCARMRRGFLYAHAKELGCNKIALGHHYDDVIETILMSMLYGAEVKTMMPKLHSNNFEGMQLIRPLYYVRENDIVAWAESNELEFIRCACRFTEHVADGVAESKRQEVKKLIAELKKTNESVEYNIFKSVYNVNLDTVIGYKADNVRHHFMDDYED